MGGDRLEDDGKVEGLGIYPPLVLVVAVGAIGGWLASITFGLVGNPASLSLSLSFVPNEGEGGTIGAARPNGNSAGVAPPPPLASLVGPF